MSKRVFRFESKRRPADAMVDGIKISGEHNVQLQIFITHHERWHIIRQLLHELEKDTEEECFPFVLFGDMVEHDLANDEEDMPLLGHADLFRLADHWDGPCASPDETRCANSLRLFLRRSQS